MKKFFAVIVLAAAVYVGYTKWSSLQNNNGAEATTSTNQNPAPGGASDLAQVKAAAPQPKVLAPEGTYFLLQGVTVTTDTGVVGLPPGTKVTMVSATPGGMLVTDGENQFEVTALQVTNDVEAAKALLNADKAAQMQLAQQISAQEQASALPLKQQALAPQTTSANKQVQR